MKKIAAVAVILSCFVCGLFAVGTVANEIALLSPIVGSYPGVTIAGVTSGGAPWVVNHGFAVLNDDQELSKSLGASVIRVVASPLSILEPSCNGGVLSHNIERSSWSTVTGIAPTFSSTQKL